MFQQCSAWIDLIIIGASKIVEENSNFTDFLKDFGLVATYMGLITKGELILRLCGFISTCSAYIVSLSKPWASVNWLQVILQLGLLIRAALLTWEVIERKIAPNKLSEREHLLFR